MNMRWACTWPVLIASALIGTTVPALGQAPAPVGYPPAAMMPQGPAAIDPAMLAAMQAAPPAGAYAPATMYMPAGAFPSQGMQPAPFMMPAAGPIGPPDVNGAYGYMPADYAAQAYAQQPFAPPGYGPSPYGPPAYGPPGYGPNPGFGFDPNVQQAAYGGPGYDVGPGPDGACGYCGGNGCDMCRGGIFGYGRHGGDASWCPNGLLGDCLGIIAPYPDGGCAAPRWFDFAVDYMMLKRDDTGRNTVFAMFGIAGAGTASGNEGVALETNDLDFGSYRPGFRLSAAIQLAAANSLEFTYFGQFNYTANATVRSGSNGLFSVVSDFGTNPFSFGPPLVAGFAETDFSDFQQLRYISKLDSFEVNWRCRWMAPNCRYQGSWSIGVRHFILDEKLRYDTSSSVNGDFVPDTGEFIRAAQARFDVDTTNNLTGIQFGTDVWICLLPGLRAGGELQAGVYGNHINVNTTIGSNQVAGDFREELDTNDVSFIGQANLLLTYRLNYQWTLRGGYQFLFVDGVALASENFNTTPPAIVFPTAGETRTPFINDNGNVFYHGWNVGLEYMW